MALIEPTNRMAPFLLLAITLVVAPGPDFAMVTRNVLRGGRRAGMQTALGVATGQTVWTFASVAGIAAILRLSTVAFDIVKLVGAAYLAYLGLKMLISAVLKRSDPDSGRDKPVSSSTERSYRQGLTCNLLNPKAAAIFTSVIPQFITPGPMENLALVELGMVFVVLTVIWLTAYAAIASRLGHVLQRNRVKRTVEGTTGFVLVGFAARLATEG